MATAIAVLLIYARITVSAEYMRGRAVIAYSTDAFGIPVSFANVQKVYDDRRDFPREGEDGNGRDNDGGGTDDPFTSSVV